MADNHHRSCYSKVIFEKFCMHVGKICRHLLEKVLFLNSMEKKLHFINNPILVTTLGITRLDAAEPDVVCLSSQTLCVFLHRFHQIWALSTTVLDQRRRFTPAQTAFAFEDVGPLMDVFCCYVWLSCSYISINRSSKTSRLIFFYWMSI